MKVIMLIFNGHRYVLEMMGTVRYFLQTTLFAIDSFKSLFVGKIPHGSGFSSFK